MECILQLGYLVQLSSLQGNMLSCQVNFDSSCITATETMWLDISEVITHLQTIRQLFFCPFNLCALQSVAPYMCHKSLWVSMHQMVWIPTTLTSCSSQLTELIGQWIIEMAFSMTAHQTAYAWCLSFTEAYTKLITPKTKPASYNATSKAKTITCFSKCPGAVEGIPYLGQQVCSHHKVKATIKSLNSIPVISPGGTTNVLQLLDISVHRAFDAHLERP